MSAVIRSINYATEHNIPILNFSGGFSYNSTALYEAVQNYPGLLVCTAGNEHQDITDSNYAVYPACHDLPNIISVGSTNSSDNPSSFSNYGYSGSKGVHLFAPGENIKSTYVNNSTATFNGTSGAAPIVAGVAALLKSVNIDLTTQELKDAILNNVDVVPALQNRCITGGRLNAFKALKSVIPTYTTLGVEQYGTRQIDTDEQQWFKFNASPAGYRFEGLGGNTISAGLYTSSFSLISNAIVDDSGKTAYVSYNFLNTQVVYFKTH